ncbi:hypothetical protein GCM10022243_66090 [Saccharothrix violaceirubra]|uniref:Uncharacterized protein n=1 Tax=Saccharothrix violaceirubra TaxID=413306 RepID=A0A7W7T9J2_9PSEU|nr:hypothetical protein [Saccharothrix violaceirubra]MBB4968906.1 hypothetical protein [Saccharothrix violaceirubra]
MNLYRQGSQEPQEIQDDLKLDEEVNKQYLEVIITFTIKNWGREPVTYSLGSPWENTGSYILYPDAPQRLWWKYRTSVDHWMRISTGEASIYRSEERPDGPTNLITLWVPVDNLDSTVNDMHKWDSYIMPITVNRLSVVAHPGTRISTTARKITHFKREWIPLREENA